MSADFANLATIARSHDYYAAACRDIELFATGATAALLRAGRMLAREAGGTLHLQYQAKASEVPVNSIAGEILVFGLRNNNPYFGNITGPVLTAPRLRPFYANTTASAALDAPVGVEIVAGLHTHAPQEAGRPVALSLRSARGALIDSRQLGSGMEESCYDLRSLPGGRYTLEEDYGGGLRHSREWLLDAELRDAAVWGVLAIRIDAGFYAHPPAFVLNFPARSETLRYYVVARGYSSDSAADLNIHDGSGQGLSFTASALPDDSNLKDALLRDGEAPVVVFQSQTEVARHEKGIKKLQLRLGNKVLIENLPLPGPERPSAELVVHLSKSQS